MQRRRSCDRRGYASLRRRCGHKIRICAAVPRTQRSGVARTPPSAFTLPSSSSSSSSVSEPGEMGSWGLVPAAWCVGGEAARVVVRAAGARGGAHQARLRAGARRSCASGARTWCTRAAGSHKQGGRVGERLLGERRAAFFHGFPRTTFRRVFVREGASP